MPSPSDSSPALAHFTALEELGLPAVLVDRASAVWRMTAEARALLGADVGDVAALLGPVHPGDREALRAALAGGERSQRVIRIRQSDLRYRAAEVLLRPHADGMLLVLSPACELEGSAEAELAALLEALPFDVWQRDTEGVLIRQNVTAQRNWGAPLGGRIDDIPLPPETLRLWRELVDCALAGEVVREEHSYAKGGQSVHELHVIAPIREAERVRGVVGVNVDVSAIRLAQAERDQSLAAERAARAAAEEAQGRAAELVVQLSDSLSELERAQQRLVQRERLAALGEMAAVVAHEVRNPVAVVFNVLSELRRNLRLAGSNAELFQILEEEASRLNRTVFDLLQFVRPMEPDRREVDLEELAREALDHALRSQPQRAAIHTSVAAAPDTPPARADPELLRLALENVVTNAMQAMPAGGELEVRLAAAERGGRRWAEARIRDTGPGIPEAVLPRIFQPFFTTRALGSGIGLALARRIVEANDGEIEASSGPVGATFTIRLPTA